MLEGMSYVNHERQLNARSSSCGYKIHCLSISCYERQEWRNLVDLVVRQEGIIYQQLELAGSFTVALQSVICVVSLSKDINLLSSC